MQFTQSQFVAALALWLEADEPEDRACAQNLVFDERIAPERVLDLEATDPTCDSDAESLRRLLIDYYLQKTIFDDIPQTFTAINSAARLIDLSSEQKMLRLECLDQPLLKLGVTLEQLRIARERREKTDLDFLDWFCHEWASRPDILKNPVSFAAFKDENIAAYESEEWPDLFRDQLGLAHYDGALRQIPVALMEYTAGEAQEQAARVLTHQFAVPTALDGQPYSHFFPTPKEMEFGSPMPLRPIQSEADLIAEILHPRLRYRGSHIAKVGMIRSAIPATDFREMRNNQLTALQLESGRDDFGEEL